MKVLVLGYGMLGKELVKQTGWDFISRKTHGVEFTEESSYLGYLNDYDIIVNCIANTDTYSKDKESMWNINYKGVSRLSDYCNGNDKKLVHISTDYVYVNSTGISSEEDIPVHHESWYSYTKLLGDSYIQLKEKDYLIIRCGHKPNPFPYPKAFDNVSGNFDYTDVIAGKIIQLINKNCTGVYNVGTENKTIFDLAKKSNSNVIPTKSPEHIPNNLEMDIKKTNNELK